MNINHQLQPRTLVFTRRQNLTRNAVAAPSLKKNAILKSTQIKNPRAILGPAEKPYLLASLSTKEHQTTASGESEEALLRCHISGSFCGRLSCRRKFRKFRSKVTENIANTPLHNPPCRKLIQFGKPIRQP